MRFEGTFSLLIPAYNEGAVIEAMLDDLAAHGWVDALGDRFEVVVVDDGSRDDTAARARAKADRFARLRVVTLSPNRGKGMALAAGVEHATGDVVGFVDGDLTFRLDGIPEMLDAFADGVDVVVGNRRALETVFDVQTDAIPYIHMRHVISANFNRLVRALTPLTVPDTQCGLKLFARPAARACFERIVVGGFVFDLELLLAAFEAGLRVVSRPVRLRYDSTEPSGHIARMSARVARDLARVAWLQTQGAYRP